MIDLIAAQAALEEESLNLGVTRYRKEREKDETATRPGKRLLVESVKPLAAALIRSGSEAPQREALRSTRTWRTSCPTSTPSLIAYLTAPHRHPLHGAARPGADRGPEALAGPARRRGELRQKLKDESPRGYRQLQRKIAHTGNAALSPRRDAQAAEVRGGPHGEVGQQGARADRDAPAGPDGAPRDRQRRPALPARAALTRASSTRATTWCPRRRPRHWLEQSHARCEMLEPVSTCPWWSSPDTLDEAPLGRLPAPEAAVPAREDARARRPTCRSLSTTRCQRSTPRSTRCRARPGA
jgi:hypothetical protein